MSRVHQLYHTLQESRLECAVLRSEARRLRRDNSELKTALEAVQRELDVLRDQCSQLREVNQQMIEQSKAKLQGVPASVEVICMDARQYESLSAHAGLAHGLERYGDAMKKLSEND